MADESARARAATSRFLSFVLRHQPQVIGVQLDDGGWVEVETLLAQCRQHGRALSREQLEEVVSTSPKRRFAFSLDGRRIRASQGHSVSVELGYDADVPPELLFHGTVAPAVEVILREGLRKMERHHVHLSADRQSARLVGGRRGQPVILRVHAGRMHRDGGLFYLSDNGVWLTDAVPPGYLATDDE